MVDLHMIQEKSGEKAKWFKDLGKAVDVMGAPAGTHAYFKELGRLLEKADEGYQADRLQQRGTLDRQTIYVTDSGKECAQQLYYDYTNTPPTNPPDAYARLHFIAGHAVEEALATVYEAGGYEVEREVHISIPIADDVPPSTGRIDFVIKTSDDLIELKKVQADKFKWEIARRAQGKWAHRQQANEYLYYYNEVKGEVRPQMTLMYIAIDAPKGTPAVFPYVVKYSKAHALANLQRKAELWRRAQAKNPPGIPEQFVEEMPVWPCLYCSYQDICKAELKERGAA